MDVRSPGRPHLLQLALSRVLPEPLDHLHTGVARGSDCSPCAKESDEHVGVPVHHERHDSPLSFRLLVLPLSLTLGFVRPNRKRIAAREFGERPVEYVKQALGRTATANECCPCAKDKHLRLAVTP
jgi:hypothetical protein